MGQWNKLLANGHRALSVVECVMTLLPSAALQASGLQANAHMYTAFMDACVKEGSEDSLQLAFQLLDRMRWEGLTPTAVTLGCVLVACEKLQDVDMAFALYQQACDEVGGRNGLVGACMGLGTHPCMGTRPHAYIVQTLACTSPRPPHLQPLRTRNAQNAEREQALPLHSQGILPTDECHNVLINVCTEAGRLDDALEQVKRLARKHSALQQHTLNSLIR
jgi:hypothetical protein